MIKYSLKCGDGHSFESWFQNSDAFDKLKSSGLVACALCGATDVEKAIMSPRVNVAEEKAPSKDLVPHSLSTPMSQAEAQIKALREKIEKSHEDVGEKFVSEVRAIQEGDAPERPIRGEATLKEAAELNAEGIAVAPLPWGNIKAN